MVRLKVNMSRPLHNALTMAAMARGCTVLDEAGFRLAEYLGMPMDAVVSDDTYNRYWKSPRNGYFCRIVLQQCAYEALCHVAIDELRPVPWQFEWALIRSFQCGSAMEMAQRYGTEEG